MFQAACAQILRDVERPMASSLLAQSLLKGTQGLRKMNTKPGKNRSFASQTPGKIHQIPRSVDLPPQLLPIRHTGHFG
jgi:hypothetical protein